MIEAVALRRCWWIMIIIRPSDDVRGDRHIFGGDLCVIGADCHREGEPENRDEEKLEKNDALDPRECPLVFLTGTVKAGQ